MSHRQRRYSKRELLGNLHVDYVMSVTDLGLAAGSNRWDVLRAFLAVGEARAERLVEEEDGFLILQSVPGQPNTGGIYLFAEPLQAFFWIRFDVKEDTLNGNDFQFALRVYQPAGPDRRQPEEVPSSAPPAEKPFRSAQLYRPRRPVDGRGPVLGGSATSGSFDRVLEPGYNNTAWKEGSTSHGSRTSLSMAATATAAGDLAGFGRAGGRIHGMVREPACLYAANGSAG